MRGGTRVVLYDEGRSARRLATSDDHPETISKKFLENIESVSKVSTTSLYSIILKGTLKRRSTIEIRSQDVTNRLTHTPYAGSLVNTLCMKVTLIYDPSRQERPKLNWNENGKVYEKGSCECCIDF